MTLTQFQALTAWHLRHWRQHPIEKHTWDTVLMVWCTAWAGALVSLVLASPFGEVVCLALLFLPSLYVGWRARLHRRGRLRCDWIVTIR